MIELIHHPVDTVVTDLAAPFKLAGTAFTAAFTVAFGNHEDRDELWQSATGIAGHLYENPEDIVAMGMQFFTPGSIVVIGSVAKIGKIASTIKVIAAFPLYKGEEDTMKLVKGLGKDKRIYSIKQEGL